MVETSGPSRAPLVRDGLRIPAPLQAECSPLRLDCMRAPEPSQWCSAGDRSTVPRVHVCVGWTSRAAHSTVSPRARSMDVRIGFGGLRDRGRSLQPPHAQFEDTPTLVYPQACLAHQPVGRRRCSLIRRALVLPAGVRWGNGGGGQARVVPVCELDGPRTTVLPPQGDARRFDIPAGRLSLEGAAALQHAPPKLGEWCTCSMSLGLVTTAAIHCN